jgi:prophage regulatory protein
MATEPKQTGSLKGVFDVPDALLRAEVVCALTGLARATLYRYVSTGNFPKQIRLTCRTARWRAGDVQKWLRDQSQEPTNG